MHRQLIFLFAFLFTSCSPGYVLRGAYEEIKILNRREKIDQILLQDEIPQHLKTKLALVKSAREFSKTLGLNPKDSFTQYSKVDRKPLVWVVVGAKPDKFELYTWWFPFVGTVPYKGFFDKEDALEEAAELQKKGFETWVRGSDAFSTLGWFNDPVLSTTLSRDDVSIVNTVIHETTHATFWISNSVEFNESLANFVGMEGALKFFSENPEYQQLLVTAKEAKDREIDLARTITELYEKLNFLYLSNETSESILTKREIIFKETVSPLKRKYPELKILSSLNNAEIMQLKIYLTGFPRFAELFHSVNQDFPAFLKKLENIKKSVEDGKEKDPFTAHGDGGGGTVAYHRLRPHDRQKQKIYEFRR